MDVFPSRRRHVFAVFWRFREASLATLCRLDGSVCVCAFVCGVCVCVCVCTRAVKRFLCLVGKSASRSTRCGEIVVRLSFKGLKMFLRETIFSIS